MNSNKFNDLIKSILYTVVFVMVLALTVKLAIGVFKIALVIFLVWLAYKGVTKLISYIRGKTKQMEHKKRGYTVNKDGIVDVDYEEVKK